MDQRQIEVESPRGLPSLTDKRSEEGYSQRTPATKRSEGDEVAVVIRGADQNISISLVSHRLSDRRVRVGPSTEQRLHYGRGLQFHRIKQSGVSRLMTTK